MPPAHRIISIGATDQNPLWDNDQGGRTGHATTVLVEAADGPAPVRLIVDPGLPPMALRARLNERTSVQPNDITHVFLTSFHPDTRRGVALFENAQLLIAEQERETVGIAMLQQLERLVEAGEGESDVAATLREDITLLQRSVSAPDRIADGVDLFPLPGVTPGMTGLLLVHPRHTVLIAGDAVHTREHLERAQVPKRAADLDSARESLAEATEIADFIIPGRDETVLNPLRSRI